MGLGDFWLQFNNGKKIRLSDIKGDIGRETVDKKYQKIFDFFDTEKEDGTKGSDGVLSKNELNSLFNSIQSAAKFNTENSIFDEKEAEEYVNTVKSPDGKTLNELGVKAAGLFEFLVQLGAEKTTSDKSAMKKPQKTNQEVEAGVIESLRADSDETLKIISNMNNGDISDIYDSVKTFLDMDTSKAKVMEAAVNQAQGAKYMEQAQGGVLTRKEYIKANKKRLQDMMKARLYKKDKNGIDYLDKNRAELKMSRKEFEALMLATIERMTEDMDIESIKEKIRQLPLTTEKGDKFLMDSVKQNAIVLFGKAKSKGYSTLDSATKYIYDTTKIAKPNPDGEKLLSFEEVFYYEQGVNYSKEDCEKYLAVQMQLTKNLSSYNKYLEFRTGADSILKEKDAEKALNSVIKLFEQFYSDPAYPNLAYKNLKSVVKNNNLPINVTQDETGRISMSMVSGSEDLLRSYVSDILTAEGNIQQERLDKIFGGNAEEKLEEMQKEVEIAHEKAYGNDFSSALGKAMMEDNQTFIQRYTGNASMTGMGLTVVGGILCFTPAAALGAVMVTAGNTLAIGGMVSESVLGFEEALTRKNGAEDGEYEELTKTMLMNLGGFGFGGVAGKTGMKLFNKFVSKELESLPKLSEAFKDAMAKGNRAEALKIVCSQPEYRKQFAKGLASKLFSDFSISYAGDLVMMGILDTQDDWESLLQSNLIGILAGMGGDIKEAAHLGMKGDKYRALRQKEGTKGLTAKEAEELAVLRNDPDIKKGYPNDEMTGVKIEGAADKKFLAEISAKFDEWKSKARPDLLQYEIYQKRYSDSSKQLLLDIAQIDPECAELIIGRYDSISDLQSIKQSVILDSKLTKQVLSIHKPLSIKERLQGKKTYYSIGYGQSILRMVKALQVIPDLEKYCNPIDYYVIDKAGDFIAFYGEEYINKNYDELSLNSKYKLYEKLLAERGLQNAVLLNVPQEVLDLFPAIPPCRLKDNTENPNYLVTIKRLHDDIYKKDYKFDANFVQKFNSDLMQFIKDKNSSYVNNLAENFRQILSEIDSKYTKENIEKVLKDFVNDSSIRNLPEVEQRIYILSQILRNNNNNINRELSKNIVKQLGFSEQEVNQVNRLLSAEDYLKNIKNCKTKEGAELLKYQAAFVLGDDNLLNIADKVYNLSKINGLKEDLKQAVFDIKSNNFAMPQTSKDDYLSASTIETTNIDGIDYKVPVVYISELTELNSYIHSTGGTTSRGRSLISVDDVLEKLNLFDEASEDNVFCTSYITKDNICVREDGIGLMFEVPTDCQYVGAGYDIGSMVRNSRDLLSEYFLPDTPMQEKVAWGMRDNVDGKHLRQIVSKNIKEIMGITDEQYVQKWDNINKQLNGQRLTIQRLEQIDSEMAQAYKIFLSRANNAQEYKDDSVLRNSKNNSIYNEVWNEFLVSKPKISGIYINAKSIEELRNKKPNLSIESWLKFAQDNNIPIVVLKPKTAKENLSLSGIVSSKVESEIPQTQLYNGKYSRPLTEYDKIGNKVFEISKDLDNPQKIAEIKSEIETLRKTEPEKAEELQIILEMFTNPTKAENVTDKQIDAVVNYLNNHYDNVEDYLTKQADGIGISSKNLGRFGHRIKGEWSTRDKVANYISDAVKKGKNKTLLDAYQDVRDKYACRTVFKNGDYTNHPEVKEILKKGNYSPEAYREAILRAAELQSQPAVDMLKEAMRKAVQEGKDLSMMRISNYSSENGVPIFSPAQLKELKLAGAQLGINVEFIKLAKEIDPNAKTEFVKDASTKKQPSGYTALQINFVTKSGEIIEWQYRGELVNEFAEAEHLPYDLRTGKHPWNQYPELETLCKPVAELLQEKNMPDYAYDQLNKYFTDYYAHLRKLELGFESKEPKLEDYENWTVKDENGVETKYSFRFDKRLNAENLKKLHFYGEGIKDGTITPERALEEYNAEVKLLE